MTSFAASPVSTEVLTPTRGALVRPSRPPRLPALRLATHWLEGVTLGVLATLAAHQAGVLAGPVLLG